MRIKFHPKQGRFLWISLLILIADQLTKCWAQKSLLMYEPDTVFSWFNLTLARNTGAAFSFLDSASGWQSVFFLCLNMAISVGILGWLFSLPMLSLSKSTTIAQATRLKSIGLSLVFGGAIGNIIDRVRLGYVIDFLDVHIGVHHWPIFNVADSAVCVGVALLMWGISREEKS